MHLDLQELSSSQVYHTLTQTVIPRPIAWVLSDNGNDSLNLAPFSYFNAVCSDPPLLILSVGKKPDGTDKDTLTNIRERDDFIIHIASAGQLDALNTSATTLPHGESELDRLELELTEINQSRLPRITRCPIAFVCNNHGIQEIGRARQALIFGEVMSVYIDDEVHEQDVAGRLKVHADKVNPLLRLGAGEYATLGMMLSRNRPA
jgi:flavin reductase (DIM6/NTAB) family NADH-FMN oxidoreductase RutF